MGTPYRTADLVTLGPLLSEHRTSGERTRATVFLGATFVLVGVAAATVFARAGGAGWIGAVMTLLLSMVGFGIAARALREYGTILRLHERGLEVIRRGESRVVRWDDVVELRSELAFETTTVGAVTWTVDRHVLVLRAGGELELRCDFADNDRVLERLRAATEPALLADAHDRLARDGVVRFGPLAITDEGIHGTGGTIPWAALRDVTVRGAHGPFEALGPTFAEVVVEGEGIDRGVETRIVEPLALVPNAHVLLAMAKRRLGGGSSGPVAPSGERP